MKIKKSVVMTCLLAAALTIGTAAVASAAPETDPVSAESNTSVQAQEEKASEAAPDADSSDSTEASKRKCPKRSADGTADGSTENGTESAGTMKKHRRMRSADGTTEESAEKTSTAV